MNFKKIAKMIIPPVAIPLIKTLRAPFFRRIKKPGNLTKRACHIHELFIRHNGDVYPCCRVWDNPKLRIGNINDGDLQQKIRVFSSPCSCGEFELVSSDITEQQEYQLLNIEVSLSCQGKCAMCCVGAPDWRGSYDYYEALSDLIKTCRPKEILVQGGEVLIQKKTMDWISLIRKEKPDMGISLVTNGNVPADMAEQVSDLFNRITISFPGFSPDTYQIVTGMDVKRSRQFAEKISERGIDVYLKFLLTPVNIHESAAFLDWAATLHPQQIQFANSGIHSYINNDTNDSFWEKILARSAEKFRDSLKKNKEKLESGSTRVVFFEDTLRMFGITQDFTDSNQLGGIIHLNLR